MTEERLAEIQTRDACSTLSHHQAERDRRELLAEIDRLRGALTEIANLTSRFEANGWKAVRHMARDAINIARATLAAKEPSA